MMKKHWILGVGLIMMLCSCGQPDTKEYLKEVIEKMESIQSVEYRSRHIVWEPYVADPLYDVVYTHHEYANPTDTAFGSSYVDFDEEMRFDGGYDGKVKMIVYHDHKEVLIDDFTVDPLPWRLVGSFFNTTKSILQYAI